MQLETSGASHTCTIETRSVVDGIEEVVLSVRADRPARSGPIRLVWRQPHVDVQTLWHPNAHRRLAVEPNWAGAHVSRAATSAPVLCLCNSAGENRLTFACSDALNAVELKAGVVEESAEIECHVKFFIEPHAPFTSYRATLRLDTRPLPFHQVLQDVSDWWATLPGYLPASVPDVARRPMYSTWYSFHQALVVDEVLQEVTLSKALGCDAIIVDDGWQNLDTDRGYATCGDWRPLRIPDMRGFVDAVHAAGQKILLWYAVPFVGPRSDAWKRFGQKLLRYDDNPAMTTGVLDPRFPDVREYLIDLYERALREWDLDGFKLDFVDAIVPSQESASRLGDGRDLDSIPEAVDRLLTDVIARLRAIKQDVMVEFRQSYVGPLMRKYGNLFRAADCPNDAITNRIRTVDIRLLCGNTAAHADMLMWHGDEPVESAALQVLNVLFSVLQISMRLDRLSEAHAQMLAFYLKFWCDYRDVLLDGRFEPVSPHAHYPVVSASNAGRRVTVVYDDVVVPIDVTGLKEAVVVNATHQSRVFCHWLGGARGGLQCFDCTGNLVRDETFEFTSDVRAVPVPRSGLVKWIFER